VLTAFDAANIFQAGCSHLTSCAARTIGSDHFSGRVLASSQLHPKGMPAKSSDASPHLPQPQALQDRSPLFREDLCHQLFLIRAGGADRFNPRSCRRSLLFLCQKQQLPVSRNHAPGSNSGGGQRSYHRQRDRQHHFSG